MSKKDKNALNQGGRCLFYGFIRVWWGFCRGGVGYLKCCKLKYEISGVNCDDLSKGEGFGFLRSISHFLDIGGFLLFDELFKIKIANFLNTIDFTFKIN